MIAEDTTDTPEETKHRIKYETTLTQDERVKTQQQTINYDTEIPSTQHTYQGRTI